MYQDINIAAKRHKRSKESFIRKNELLDVESLCTEVYQYAVFFPAGPKIAKKLCDMFIGSSFCGFQLDDQETFDEQVGKVFADWRAIFVKYGEWPLLFYLKPELAKSISQSILINFLEMAIAEILVHSKRSFSNDIAKLTNAFLISHIKWLLGFGYGFLWPLVPFRGNLESLSLWFSNTSMLAREMFCCPAVGVRVKLLQAAAIRANDGDRSDTDVIHSSKD